MGIFGYLSKAHLDQAGVSSDAIAAVERLDGQISREENKISILQDRLNGLSGNTGINLSSSITQQESIRDGAWEQVQGDIDYNQQQISSVREQLTLDLQGVDSREEKIDVRLSALDSAVNDLRSKGVEVIETDAGGAFRRAETETIDYVAQANDLRDSQQAERTEIANQKQELKTQRQDLRDRANADIKLFQSAIDRYRAQAQTTIDSANAEINNLRGSDAQNQDDTLAQIDDYNNQIDTLYDGIAVLKEDKFEAESVVRVLEKEVGPIKYVAQLLYGNDSADYLDQSVRLFILMLVFVFDPLAVILLIAANQTLIRYGINLESEAPENDRDISGGTDTPLPSSAISERSTETSGDEKEHTTQVSGESTDAVSIQQVGPIGEHNDSSIEDKSNGIAMTMAATTAAESAALRNEIDKIKKMLIDRPKEVIIEADTNVQIETPQTIIDLENELSEKLKGTQNGE